MHSHTHSDLARHQSSRATREIRLPLQFDSAVLVRTGQSCVWDFSVSRISCVQAVACAEAHVTLISPFVGRILDFHKAEQKRDWLNEPVAVARLFRKSLLV